MPGRRSLCLALLVLFSAASAFAQFTRSVQGVVQDPSGAGIAKATLHLVSVSTNVTQVTTSDDAGNFRFLSLAPGSYKVTVEATGFAKSEVDITLLTAQNLSVPVTLKVGSISEAVSVTTEAPVVDTADSRTQLTLENQAVAELPIVGRNLVTLVTMAPGVSGLGTSAAGSPASGVDNFSTEEQVDASANGQGGNNNQYVVDGLDVTSGIRQGVLNLTPQPEAIRETSIQVNTFSSEYSRAAGLQTVFTTRSGTNDFHGSASDYFNYQGMYANQHFVSSAGAPYLPFHSNNFGFAIGGRVIPHHGCYFYFAVEPLRSSSSAGGSVNYVDPAFIAFAQANNPGTVGTGLLSTYQPAHVTLTSVENAQTYFALPTGGSLCNTASTEFIPCASNVVDTGSFGATPLPKGTQYFGRPRKGFESDRIYASIFRTLLLTGTPSSMPQFSALENTWQVAGQASWVHTFSPTLLNEFTIGQSRVQGIEGSGAPASSYYVPSVTVNGISMDAGQGV